MLLQAVVKGHRVVAPGGIDLTILGVDLIARVIMVEDTATKNACSVERGE